VANSLAGGVTEDIRTRTRNYRNTEKAEIKYGVSLN
jgi:hypothetical protein